MTWDVLAWWIGGWPFGAAVGWIAHDLRRTRNLTREVSQKVDKILEHEENPDE